MTQEVRFFIDRKIPRFSGRTVALAALILLLALITRTARRRIADLPPPITIPRAPIVSKNPATPIPKLTPSARQKPTSPAVSPRPVVPAAPPVVPVPAGQTTEAAPPAPPAAEEPVEWQGNDTAITHSGEVVVRNDHQWIMFWAEHRPHEPAPDVDFSRKMVVGVFSGPRPADAFAIRIENVRMTPAALFVDYREQLPPPGTFAVDVTVYPYHIKIIPRTDLPVTFNKLELINPNR